MANYTALYWLTGLVILGLAFYSYRRTGDALAPAVLTGPLFLYVYCYRPLVLSRGRGLGSLFSVDELAYVALLELACIGALYLGMARNLVKLRRPLGVLALLLDGPADVRLRQRLVVVAMVLGLASVGSFLYGLENVGGFVEAYSRVKGGGRAASGYINELVLLSFPAVILLALAARYRGRMLMRDLALALLFASPHLIQGTFGGRRGPLFLALTILFLAWFIARGRMPKFRTALIGVGLIGLAVIVVWSQRQHLYLGSGGSFQADLVMERVQTSSVLEGDTYVVGAGAVLSTDFFRNYYWGYRYFVTFIIRPIPRQIWRTKYRDVGADWLYGYGDEVRADRYGTVVGFVPLAGSAPGGVADVYQEFSWGAVLFFYVIGRMFGGAYRRFRVKKGIWMVVYATMIVLSIYLASQSFTAFGHRLFFICGMNWLIWRFWVGPAIVRAHSRAGKIAGLAQAGRGIRHVAPSRPSG